MTPSSPARTKTKPATLSAFAAEISGTPAAKKSTVAGIELPDLDALNLGLKDDGEGEGADEGLSLRERLLCDIPDEAEREAKVLGPLRRMIGERMEEGHGEAVFEVGCDDRDSGKTLGFSREEYAKAVETLRRVCEGMMPPCIFSELSTRNLGREGEPTSDGKGCLSRVMIRRTTAAATDTLEVRVAVVGNVDAGKSTMLGVLTKGALDDGRGKARIALFRHKHEAESGRTSAVGNEILGFTPTSQPILPTGAVHKLTWEDIAAKAAKVISFIDLAGHEKYLKTTVFGMVGHLPDYCMLMVGANAGLVGMSKEHLGIALALNVPVFVVITKIDMCPAPVLQATITQLTKILKSPGVRKMPLFIGGMDEAVTSGMHFSASQRVCPIFQVSNVTGQGLDFVRSFLNILPVPILTHTADEPVLFRVSDTFSVPFVGAVVSGVIERGTVRAGDTLLLGPDATDAFVSVGVRTIQRKRINVPFATPGQSVSFALKRLRRKDIRKGQVLLSIPESPTAQPHAIYEFVAEVLVLYHATTLKPNYQAMVHIGSITQTAQVVEILDRQEGEKILRTGDRGRIRFRFIRRGEFLVGGEKVLFREGRTKGLGRVVEVGPK
ncbi:hypothetical protein YB2330_005494 [Saitoella coloradoensis]